MTEETVAKLNGVIDFTKHQSWKWLGALIMKPKKDAEGNVHLAVSLTKVQKLVSILMAVALFVTMVVLWIVKADAIAGGTGVLDPIPASMERTLWGLLGLTGVNMVSGAIAAKGSGGEDLS